MAYLQLVQPNLATVGRIGYCLEYARKAYSAPVVEPNAWAGWQNAQFKHTDSLPGDVCVPMWYDYWVGGQRLGHVTINVPGKGIYSSPWKLGTDHAVLPSIAEVERIYGVKYVGWSEDISKVRVVKGDAMTRDQLTQLHRLVMGTEPGPDYLTAFTGRSIDEAMAQLQADDNRLQLIGLMDKPKLSRLHRLAIGSEPGPDYLAAFANSTIDKSMKQLEDDPNRLNNKPSLVASPLAPGIYQVK